VREVLCDRRSARRLLASNCPAINRWPLILLTERDRVSSGLRHRRVVLEVRSIFSIRVRRLAGRSWLASQVLIAFFDPLAGPFLAVTGLAVGSLLALFSPGDGEAVVADTGRIERRRVASINYSGAIPLGFFAASAREQLADDLPEEMPSMPDCCKPHGCLAIVFDHFVAVERLSCLEDSKAPPYTPSTRMFTSPTRSPSVWRHGDAAFPGPRGVRIG